MTFKQSIKLPQKKRPIVIIGGGGIIRDAHLPAYRLAGFEVLGIFDKDLSKARVLADDFHIKEVYDSLESAIASAKVSNAVFDIAIPTDFILQVLEQLPDESSVLIQKPMGKNLQQAKEILNLCRRKKLVSAINFQLRYAPYMIAAKDIIVKGLIGEVYDWELLVCVHTPWHLWDFLFEVPRVEILYHSIHYLDLSRHFLGDPHKIYASTITSPKTKALKSTRSTMILDYDHDLQARIITNHCHDFGKRYQQSYLKIEGTKGAIRIRIGLSLNYPKGKSPKMEYCLSQDNYRWKKIPLCGGWFPHAFMGTMATLQNHLNHPKNSLYNSTEDALQTMKLVELAYQSSEQGGITFKKK